MITAIDSNILIYVIKEHDVAIEAMSAVASVGKLIICEIVYAELCAGMPQKVTDQFLASFQIELQRSSRESLAVAGRLWREHVIKEGRKGKVIADFFVGAHAKVHANQLMSNDRGFYRKYYRDLKIVGIETE